MRNAAATVLVMFMFTAACTSSKDGPVNTAEQAISRSRGAWQAIYEKTQRSVYSKESTAKFEPYTVSVQDGAWLVRGTVPSGYRGELLQTRVQKSDGQVSVEVVSVK